jgi:hypothetical protein
MQQTQTSNSQ